MQHLKRFFLLTLLLLGSLGVVTCASLIGGVWLVDARLSQGTEGAFATLDASLTRVRERVGNVRERIDNSRVTSREIQEKLAEWAQREAGEQLAERLEVAKKTQRLAEVMQRADVWLEAVARSLEFADSALQFVNAAGLSVEAIPVAQLLFEISSVRSQLHDVSDMVTDLRNRTATDDGKALAKERLDQAGKLAVRVVASADRIETRLQRFDGKLAKAQDELKNMETGCLRWIHAGAIGMTLLFIWMLAAQLTLANHGWSGLRGGRNQQQSLTSHDS